MPRILFPLTSLDGGGDHVSPSRIAAWLATTPEWTPSVALPTPGPAVEIFRRVGVEPRLYGMSREATLQMVGEGGTLAKIRSLAALYQCQSHAFRYLASERPHLLHVNDARTLLAWGPAAKRRRLPVVLHDRTTGRKAGWIVRAISMFADHIISVSHFQSLESRRASRKGVPPVSVIHNAVDPNRYAARMPKDVARHQLGLDASLPVVGFIGRHDSQKRPDWVFRTAELLLGRGVQAQFVFVGVGRLEPELKALVDQRGLADRVTFLGFRHDIPEVLNAIDILAFPAVREGFGLTVIEAMAASVPVVAVASGGPIEILEGGVGGVMVDPDDLDSFAEAVEGLVTDPRRREAMGAEAAAVARARFSEDQMMESILTVYRRVLAYK